MVSPGLPPLTPPFPTNRDSEAVTIQAEGGVVDPHSSPFSSEAKGENQEQSDHLSMLQ